jgi:hypothetical protein
MKTNTLNHLIKSIAAFAFLFLFIFTTNAQQLLIKTSDGKVRAIKSGQKMHFKLHDDIDFTKGKIQSFTDSSIVVFMPDEDDVLLQDIKIKDIKSIKKTSTMHKLAQGGGALFMVGGAAMIFEAPSIAGEDGSDWLVRGVGVVTLAVGLIPYLIKPKTYVQGENAEFSISK